MKRKQSDSSCQELQDKFDEQLDIIDDALLDIKYLIEDVPFKQAHKLIEQARKEVINSFNDLQDTIDNIFADFHTEEELKSSGAGYASDNMGDSITSIDEFEDDAPSYAYDLALSFPEWERGVVADMIYEGMIKACAERKEEIEFINRMRRK